VQEYVASYLIEHLDYALGNLFPTTFESFNPAGMPTLEVRFFPVPDFYVKSAVLSGNRNPYQPAPPELTSKFAIPLILSLKLAIWPILPIPLRQARQAKLCAKTYPGHYKFGAAYNGGKFRNPRGLQSNGNYLIYFGANQAVYRAEAGSNRGLDLELAYDWSPGDVNRQNSQLITGFRCNGLISQRDQDGLGLRLCL